MDKELEKDFQQRPAWIWISIIVSVITTSIYISPILSNLVIDFFPNFTNYKKWIQLSFIITVFVISAVCSYLFWKANQKKQKIDKMSMTEKANSYGKRAKWLTWRQNIFNAIKLGIIPPIICWIISQFINKKYKPYRFYSFDFPRYWEKHAETPEEKEKYNYEKVTSQFFKSMFDVSLDNLNQKYEVKFERDFQSVEIRWNNKAGEKFNNTKKDLYDKVFSEEVFKHLKIFTWIFPFGLCWNLRRIIKNLFLQIKRLKNYRR